MYKMIATSLAIFSLIVSISDAMSLSGEKIEQLDRSNPYRTIEQFVRLEYQGVANMRLDFVRFTDDSREARHVNMILKDCEERVPESSDCGSAVLLTGVLLDYLFDDYVAVTDYHVKEVQVDGDKGKAVILYHKVAERTNIENVFKIEVFDESEEVALDMEKVGGKWVVVDPPSRRVSLFEIYQYYHSYLGKIRGFDNQIIPHDGLIHMFVEHDTIKEIKERMDRNQSRVPRKKPIIPH
ncbi:MAG: hypothetical protein HQL51_10515 [Magnetococcales bacterium]|nr:hypothetical protein [Magnetococcales bacterium]